MNCTKYLSYNERKEMSEKEPTSSLLMVIITGFVVVVLIWSWIFKDLEKSVTMCNMLGGDLQMVTHTCYDKSGHIIRMK